MISDDKYYELLTAGIARLSIPDADVEWDCTIDGRQFDVIVKFKAGLHVVMLAFEVKAKSRPTSVEQIDAFVTKARDAGAGKAVFVSTTGFQSGAVAVAKRHKMDLFTLSFVDGDGPQLPQSYVTITRRAPDGSLPTNVGEPPRIEEGPTRLGIAVEGITLEYADGSRVQLPNEMSQLTYYANQIVDEMDRPLVSTIEPYLGREVELDREETVRIQTDISIKTPDRFFAKDGRLSGLELHIAGREFKTLSGNVRMEVSSFSKPVVYENVLTGEKLTSKVGDLPVGPQTPKIGAYYFQYYPLRYYYCDALRGDLMTLYMVESFQNGELFQAVFTQEARYIRYYIPLANKGIEARLHDRLWRMKNDSSDTTPRGGSTDGPNIKG